jgi:tRNA modification GTPase
MSYSLDNQTIIAQCTPQGNGAIALIRMSGEEAIAIATRMSRLTNKQILTEKPSHTIHYGSIHDQGKTIDHVIFFIMRAPKTFTGQNTVEISCHNNQFIVQSIIACAIKHGARIAQPGEFTKRAVLQKKIDLIQAEAINELIHAHSQESLKLSLSQLKGSLSQRISQIENTLIKALAIAEASFEFVDDDLEVDFAQEIQELVLNSYNNVKNLVQQFSQQKQIRNGIKIACIGSVNAGKSSLFNALVGTDRAIVTNIPGTTRDTIEEGLYVNGRYWSLVDTAGLRETTHLIEQQGIKRSLAQAQEADIILLVFDTSKRQTSQDKSLYSSLVNQYRTKIICVLNKYDLKRKSKPILKDITTVSVSAKTGYQIDVLHKTIEEKIEETLQKYHSPFLLNQRHVHILLSVSQELEHIYKNLSQNIGYEILAVHIKDTLILLMELTGKSVTEKALDKVFKDFCIGK